ncbi:N(5)-(carboxyethyl)ornithine synthase, partial [Lactococcus lactis subsp. lactis]|nr:N(5)-(carboxyethyl)ornithine synthase [Lactococcus lactis subsp. lactis]
MKIGLVKANFPGERRVPLLPKDIKDFKNEILVEEGFGKFLDIDDQDYIDKGCHILSRAEVFAESEAIFSLKLIQPTDYSHLREGQMIIGWTHPFGSGQSFMKE